ncbi:hypothetical protein CJF34_05240 [Pseudomonas lundensis]|nr:hypothetical protein CJF34_05240 [Pseudomonas lundensis]
MCLLARTSSIKSAFLFLCFPGFREEPKIRAFRRIRGKKLAEIPCTKPVYSRRQKGLIYPLPGL